MSRLQLHWLGWDPTPHNDVLFRAIASEPDVDLMVHYCYSRLSSHPWKSSLGLGYPRRCYEDVERRKGVDWSLLRQAVSDRNAFFVLTGTPGRTSKAMLLVLLAARRPFDYWTDTPQLVKLPLSGFLANRVHSPWVESVQDQDGHSAPRADWCASMLRHQLIFRSAARVMSTGTVGVERLLQMGCRPEKAINLPFFVDLASLDQVSKRRRNHYGHRPFRFLFVGRLVPSKGYRTVIRAFALAKRMAGLPAELWIAGDGPGGEDAGTLARVEGVSDVVRFLGWQEPDALLMLWGDCDVFVQPALRDPFPVTVLSAMGAGLPVLGSDACGSVVDRVRHGLNGFVHRRGDAVSLARHMVTLLEQPGLVHQMGLAARCTAEEWPVCRGVKIVRAACGLGELDTAQRPPSMAEVT